MSAEAIPAQEWKRALSVAPAISDGAKVTGFVLVEFFDFRKADFWSAQRTLAEKRGKSERAVREHISELVSGGFLASRRGGAGQANRYEKALPDRQESASLDRQNSAGLNDPDRRKSASQTGGNLPVQTGENLPHHSNPLKEPLEHPLEGESPPTPSARKAKAGKSDAEPDGFEAFWNTYPRKVSKGAARTAFAAALRKTDAATILAATERYADERRNEDPKYTKHPTTWLRAEAWLDEAKPVHVIGPDQPARAAPSGRPVQFSATERFLQKQAERRAPDRARQAFDQSFGTLDLEAVR